MLCKVDNNDYSISKREYLFNNSVSKAQQQGNFDIETATVTRAGTYTYSIRSNRQIKLVKGTEQIDAVYNNVKSGSVNAVVGDNFKIQGYSDSSGVGITATYTYSMYIIFPVVTLYKTIFTHKSKPRQLKAIGEKTTCTLFGYHTDNTRYNVENE